jgi:hypothetical protein
MLLWPKLLELRPGSTAVARGIHLGLRLGLARLGLRARWQGADRHGGARGVRRSGSKGELRSTLTRAEGTGVHAGAHRGLGLAGARVQGGRRRWPGGGGSRGSRGRLAQRDSRVLGALDRLKGCLWWCAGGQNGQNSTGGEEITMAEQLTGGDSLAKSRQGRSSGLDCRAQGAP